MADILDIGVSALIGNQRVLSTTSHNIANVNTEGYSRQRVSLTARQPQVLGVGYIGKGVDVSAVTRIADQFLIGQLRSSSATQAKAQAFVDLADQVDSLMGDSSFSQTVGGLFTAVHDANSRPASMAAREAVLVAARALSARLSAEDGRLSAMNKGLNDTIRATVNQINSLAESIATINAEITRTLGVSQGAPPNDLIDKRDQLLITLGDLVGVATVEQSDGAVNVFMGGGQLLVAGSLSVTLTAAPNSLDPSRTEVAIDTGATTLAISDSVVGGELAGVLEFRDQVLDPTRNGIGRLAAAIAMAINAQHRAGMDANGDLGADLFAISSPLVNAAPANTGTVTVALNPADVGGLTTSDYRLTHDGTDFILTQLSTGTQQTLSGGGPFNVEGMTITVTSAPAAGDVYLLQPTRPIARNMSVVINDPTEVALARPIRTTESSANLGAARISAGEILDVTDANLLVTTQVIFDDPPTTFKINGVGPSIAYTSGANIDRNGWRVQIEGIPEPGDNFTVAANVGGIGDNANGLALADAQFTTLLENATLTFQDALGQLASDIGARNQQAQITLDAMQVLRANAQAARDEVSGVNLDEEAADLLRYQQAYQAAAQVILVATETFDALFAAMRRA